MRPRRRLNGRDVLLGAGALATALQLSIWLRQMRTHGVPYPISVYTRGQTLGQRTYLRSFGVEQQTPLSQVYRDRSVTLYSRLPNRINSVSRRGKVAWLGTRWGARRVDEASGAQRHYAERDGLPGANVVAIAAEEDGSAWCIVQSARNGRKDRTVTLCRFDPSADRWRTLRILQLPGLDSPSPADVTRRGSVPLPYRGKSGRPGVVALNRFVVFSPGAPGGRTAQILLHVWDKRERAWQDALRIEEKDTPDRLAVNFLAAESGSGNTVWLGTSAGLFTFRAAERRWERFLPERAFFAGIGGKDGGEQALWLLNRPTNRATPAQGGSDGSGWLLTRFDTRAGTRVERTRDWALPEPKWDSPSGLAVPGAAPLGIGVTPDGAVWVPAPSTHGMFADAVFHVLDPRSGPLRTVAGNGLRNPALLGAVPDEALLPLVSLPPNALLTPWLRLEVRARFARWLRPAAPLPPRLTATRWVGSSRFEEPGGVTWGFDSQGTLTRTVTDGKHGATTVHFPTPAGTSEGKLYLFAPTRTRDAIWALAQDSSASRRLVARFDKAARAWTVYDNKSVFPGWGFIRRLISDGDTVWALASETAYRFEPKTGEWVDVLGTLPSLPGQWLIRDLATDDRGRFIWALLGRKPGQKQEPGLASYDKHLGSWMMWAPKGGFEQGVGSLMVEPAAVWIAIPGGALRFDPAAWTWRRIAPPPLPADSAVTRIVRGSDGALWFIGPEHVLRWNGTTASPSA